MSRTDTAPQDSGSPSVPVKLAAAGAGVASSSRVADDRAFRADREVRRSSLPKISAEAWVQITLGAIVTALLVFVSSLPKRGPAREDPSRVAAARSLHAALQKLRTAVSDYRFDHGEWPGSPSAASGPADSHAFADDDLSSFHDAHGSAATQPVEYRLLDAYLDGHVPVNPIDGLSTVRLLGDDERWPDAADDSSGWTYRPRTGEIRANCRGCVPGSSLRYFDL